MNQKWKIQVSCKKFYPVVNENNLYGLNSQEIENVVKQVDIQQAFIKINFVGNKVGVKNKDMGFV